MSDPTTNALLARIKELEEALKFYADPENYIEADWGDCITKNATPVIDQEGALYCDCGNIARKALNGHST